MPKYVFEVALTTMAGDELSVDQCNAISELLARRLEEVATVLGKRGGRISAEAPFEQVTGDWLPPDENGVVKASPESRPINWEPGVGPS